MLKMSTFWHVLENTISVILRQIAQNSHSQESYKIITYVLTKVISYMDRVST